MKPIFYCVILLALSTGNGLENETQHTDHHQPAVPQHDLTNIRRYLPTLFRDSRQWFIRLIPPPLHQQPQNGTLAVRTNRAISPKVLELFYHPSDHPITIILELVFDVHLLLEEFFHIWHELHESLLLKLLLPFGFVSILIRLLAAPLFIGRGILGYLFNVIGTVFLVVVALITTGLRRATIVGLVLLKNLLPIPRILSIVLSLSIIKFLLGDICQLIRKLIKWQAVGGSLELYKPFNRFASLLTDILKGKLLRFPIKRFIQLPQRKLMDYFVNKLDRPSFHRVLLKIFLVFITLPLRLLFPPIIPILDAIQRVILNIIDDLWTYILGANQSVRRYLPQKTAGEKIHSMLKYMDRIIGAMKVVSAHLSTNSGRKVIAFLRPIYSVITAIPRLLFNLLFSPLIIIIRLTNRILGIAPGQSKLEHALTIMKDRIANRPLEDPTTTIPVLINHFMAIKDELVRIGEEVLKNRLQITDFSSLIMCVLNTLFQKFDPNMKAIVIFFSVLFLVPIFANLPLFLVLIALWILHHFFNLFALPNIFTSLLIPVWFLRKLLKFLWYLLHKHKVNVYFLRVLPLWPFNLFKLLRFILSIIITSFVPLPFRLAFWPLATLFQTLLFPLFAGVLVVIRKVIEALFPILTANWIPLLFKIVLLPLEIVLLPLRILLLPLKLLLLPFKFLVKTLISLPLLIIQVVFEALFPVLSSEYIPFLIKIALLPLEIILLPFRLLFLPVRILLLPLNHFLFAPFQSLFEPISPNPPAERVLPFDSPLHKLIRVLLIPLKLLLLPFKILLFIFNQFIAMLLPGLTSSRPFIVKLLILLVDLLLLPLRILFLPFKILLAPIKFVVMLPIRLFWEFIGFSPDSTFSGILPTLIPFGVRSIIKLLSLPFRAVLKVFDVFRIFPSNSADRRPIFYTIFYSPIQFVFPIVTSSLPFVLKLLLLPIELIFLPFKLLLLPFKLILLLLKIIYWIISRIIPLVPPLPLFKPRSVFFVDVHPFGFLPKIVYFVFRLLFPVLTSRLPWVVKILSLPLEFLLLPLRVLLLPLKAIVNVLFFTFLKVVLFLFPPSFAILDKMPIFTSTLPLFVKLPLLPLEIALLPFKSSSVPFGFILKLLHRQLFNIIRFPLNKLFPFLTSTHPFVVKLILLPFDLLGLPFRLLRLPFEFIFGLPFVLFPVLMILRKIIVLPFKLLLPLTISSVPFLIKLLMLPFDLLLLPLRLLLLPFKLLLLPFKLLRPSVLLEFVVYPLFPALAPLIIVIKIIFLPFYLLKLPFELLFTILRHALPFVLLLPLLSIGFPLLLLFPLLLIGFPVITIPILILLPLILFGFPFLLKLLLLPLKLILPLLVIGLPFLLLLPLLLVGFPVIAVPILLVLALLKFGFPFVLLLPLLLIGFPVIAVPILLLLPLILFGFPFLVKLLLLPLKLVLLLLKVFLVPFFPFFPVFEILIPSGPLWFKLLLIPFNLLFLPFRLLLLPFKLLLIVPKYILSHFFPFFHFSIIWVLEYIFPILRPDRPLLLKLLLIPFDLLFLPLRLLLLPFKLVLILLNNCLQNLPIFWGPRYLLKLIKLPIDLLFPVLTSGYPLFVKLLLLPSDFLLLPLRLLLIPFKLPFYILRSFVSPLSSYIFKLPFLPPLPRIIEKILNEYALPLINLVKLIISTLFPVFLSNDSLLVKILFWPVDLVLLPLRLVLLPIELLNALLENIKFGLMPAYIPAPLYPIIVTLVHVLKPIWLPFIFLYRLIRVSFMVLFPILRPTQSLLSRLVLIPFDLLLLPLRLLLLPLKLFSIVFKYILRYLPTVTIDFLFPILTSNFPWFVKLLLSPLDFLLLPLKVLLLPLKFLFTIIWNLTPFANLPYLPIAFGLNPFKPLLLPLVHLPKLIKLLLEYLFPILRPDRSILVKLLLIPLDLLLLPLRLLFLPLKLLFYVFLRIILQPIHPVPNFPFWLSPSIADGLPFPFLRLLIKHILKLLFLPITVLFPVLCTDYPLLMKLLLLPFDFLLLPLRIIKLPYAFFQRLLSIIIEFLYKLTHSTTADVFKSPIISRLFRPQSLILDGVTFISNIVKLFNACLLLPLRQAYTFLSKLPSVLLPLPFDVILSAPHELLLTPFRSFVNFHKIILDTVNYILSKLSSLYVNPFKPLILSPLETLQNHLPGLFHHLFRVSTLFKPITVVVILFLPIPIIFKLLLLLSLLKFTIFSPFTILANIRQITPHLLLAGALALLPIPILFKIILLFKIIQRIFRIQEIAVVKGLSPYGLGSKLKPA